MNCAPRPFLAIFTLLAAATAASAQPSPPPWAQSIPQPAANALEPIRGKVLLLDNDRILEGDIEKVNDQYRIRRSVGELWVNADRGKRLCKDLDEAYELMKRQINLKDADERLRLSRWCQMNGLKTQALAEARIAQEMRPDHLETLRMVQMLQRLAVASHPALVTPQPAPPVAVKSPPRPALDVSAESFAMFSTRVQPILMNTCVTCHSQGRGGAFQLVRVTEGNSRASAQTNLTAALEFVNVDKAVLSPLLIKSVVAHGGAATAPLKGRQSAPFQALQTWVDETLASNPHLKEIRQAEGQAGPLTSAKKDYVIEPFAVSERPVSPPPSPMAPNPGAPAVQPQPLQTTPLQATPLPPAPQPIVPIRDLGYELKKSGEIVSRPTPRFDEQKTPPAVSAPANPPTVAPGPRDPFDPAEFNSRPK